MTKASRPGVCAVVLNWNGADEAIHCLEALAQQSYPNLDVVVVDNGSRDDSVARIRAACPQVELLRNSHNLGFSGGINVGLRHALAAGFDYVLPLNNDLVLAPGCVEELVACAEQGYSFVTATIYYADDRQRIWSIGGNLHPLTLEKTGDARGEVDTGQLPRVIERNFVPGGATLMARRALQEIGLFDESYFLYYEDMDLSLRAYRSDLRAAAATRAHMWHSISRSSGGSDSPRERYWMARSSVRYFGTHARLWQRPLIFYWRLGSALRTTLRLLRKGRGQALAAYWRGLGQGIVDLFRDRPVIQRED